MLTLWKFGSRIIGVGLKSIESLLNPEEELAEGHTVDPFKFKWTEPLSLAAFLQTQKW